MASSDILNINWSQAEGMISSFQGQTKKFQEEATNMQNMAKGIGDDMWAGAGREAFNHWLQSEFIPAAEDVASALLPGFGSALTSMLDMYRQAEGAISAVAGGVQG